ncbi:hypothetical protein FNV43_RR17878 [Rhamnella rubrinervis]|uniref:GATA-type domain-containing protein n=1 Tax=Rhamnella rubrinervis TaxID=2594499 RepID=A0A8K0GXY7_9ROSA|nr:hypothetical protein FNV43_RR17878 [Rhamnella rubrinervis]
MAPPCHHPPPSSFHGPNEDDHHHHDLFNPKPDTCSSLSLSSPIFINPAHDHQGELHYNTEAQKFQVLQVEADKKFSCGGSCNQYPTDPENESHHHDVNIDGLKLSIWKNNIDDHTNENQSVDQNSTNSVKWMSSKMRMMRKMMNPADHQTIVSTDPPVLQQSTQKLDENKEKHPASPLGATDSCSSNNNSSNNSNINNSNTTRVCADCNTTKTPLWRSGPRGPKSLCNACGIRQRKARRAMAAAAAASANGTVNNVSLKGRDGGQVQQKDKKSRKLGCDAVQFKKRTTKLTSPIKSRIDNEKLCFEDQTIKYMMSQNSAFQRSVFPQDEKEAAILLMALSYGLVHG